MKTLFTLLMPILIIATFMISSHLFSTSHYLSSAAFTLVSYAATSIWIAVISAKKPVLA